MHNKPRSLYRREVSIRSSFCVAESLVGLAICVGSGLMEVSVYKPFILVAIATVAFYCLPNQ